MKEPIIKVKKKGKTVGRPSRVEKNAEAIINHYLSEPNIRKILTESVFNAVAYGKEFAEEQLEKDLQAIKKKSSQVITKLL